MNSNLLPIFERYINNYLFEENMSIEILIGFCEDTNVFRYKLSDKIYQNILNTFKKKI